MESTFKAKGYAVPAADATKDILLRCLCKSASKLWIFVTLKNEKWYRALFRRDTPKLNCIVRHCVTKD
uniref:Uncharacterized protein n=1 Tax=Romanomermis culicivorax TaxID=13658 RepID=A0A915KME9_ROMCU